MKIANSTNELVITIPKGILELKEIQDFLDLIKYKMLVARSQASDAQIEEMANEINEELGKWNQDNH